VVGKENVVEAVVIVGATRELVLEVVADEGIEVLSPTGATF
jgi:hypothetical protein